MKAEGKEEEFSSDLKAVHEANLYIMREIDKLSKRHGISYRMDSGTLLGAVRHRGFIPWDDDADLLFRREEFSKLCAVSAELPEDLKLLLPWELRKGRAFYDFVPRILYLRSRRHGEESAEQEFYEGKLNHLWVDLFILDALPDNPFLSALYRFRQKLVFGLAMGHRMRIELSKYKGLQRLQVLFLSGIGRLIPMPLLFRLQERWAGACTRACRGSGRKTKRSYFSNYQPDFQHCTVENAWEEPYSPFAFEGERFPGPKNWDRVLRMLYGDYRRLPPEEERRPSHSGQIELWKSTEWEERHEEQ